jgi:hypothetical protein
VDGFFECFCSWFEFPVGFFSGAFENRLNVEENVDFNCSFSCSSSFSFLKKKYYNNYKNLDNMLCSSVSFWVFMNLD